MEKHLKLNFMLTFGFLGPNLQTDISLIYKPYNSSLTIATYDYNLRILALQFKSYNSNFRAVFIC